MIAAGFAEKANQSTDSKITSSFAVVPVRLAAIQVRVAFVLFFKRETWQHFRSLRGGLGRGRPKIWVPPAPAANLF